MVGERGPLARVGKLPHAPGLIVATDRDKCSPIRGNGTDERSLRQEPGPQAVAGVTVELFQLAALLHVPQAHESVDAAGGEGAAIGRKSNPGSEGQSAAQFLWQRSRPVAGQLRDLF